MRRPWGVRVSRFNRRSERFTFISLKRKYRPNCIDVFAGAGGLAEGFREAGWRILGAVDNDRYAAETFKMNFPDAIFYEQAIENVNPIMLLKENGLRVGEVDCLLGGPPCQSFSYNNHFRTATDHRARLFQHYLRMVEKIRPKTLVMENVPGMLTIGNGRVLKEIRYNLAKLGYEAGIRILYAEDYGIPQQRRRVFIIGTRLGWDESLFPAGTHGPSRKPSIESNIYIHRWVPDRKRLTFPLVTVWEAIGDLPSVPNGCSLNGTYYTSSGWTEYQNQARHGCLRLYNHVARRLSPKMLLRVKAVPEGGNWRSLPRHLLPDGMRRARPNDHTKRYGRLAKKGLASTVLTKCDPHWGSYIHPVEDRTITVREAARLQSFPDRFRFCQSITRAYEQIGNAVPPLLAKHIAKAVSQHLTRKSLSRGPHSEQAAVNEYAY